MVNLHTMLPLIYVIRRWTAAAIYQTFCLSLSLSRRTYLALREKGELLKIQIMKLSAEHIKNRNIIIYLEAAARDYILSGQL
jgi:hypothetical protein